MKTLTTVIISIIIVDVLGFLLWTASGQVPQDDFFLGTLTASAIDLFQ